MITAAVADAVYVPGSLRRGATMPERLASVLRIAEPMLGVDRSRGERGYVRVLKAGADTWLYITKDPNDQLLHPLAMDGPLRGKPRYDWIEGPQGVRLGYLTTAARELMKPVASKPPGT